MTYTKKGQITIFIIVGVLILAAAGLLFFLKDSTAKKQLEPPLYLDTQPIEMYVQQCQEKAVEEAILETGKSGGYTFLPERSTTDLRENVPYYRNQDQDYFPTEEQLAQEIARYADAALPLCLQQFKLFIEKGYSIAAGDPTSTARLGKKKITLTTTLPLTIAHSIQVRDLSVFTAEVPAEQLYQNLQVARAVVGSLESSLGGTEGSKNQICLTCFAALAEEQNILVGIIPIGKNSYLFDLQDQDYKINGEQYHLRFAVGMEKEMETEIGDEGEGNE